jgi:hypothetical protein
MPPKTFYRRVNKHIKTLHCECGKSYTRADHFERHKRNCKHNSEYVAASEPLPSPDLLPFYCSCGAGFTAADAFLRHRNRMRHEGNWEQSRYQPKGHAAASITAEPQGDLVEQTGARELEGLPELPSGSIMVSIETEELIADMVAARRSSDFDDSSLGSSVKGDGSDSPQGEDPVASPVSDPPTSDVESFAQDELSVNIIETSSETTDVAVVPEGLEVTQSPVTSTLQELVLEAAIIEAVFLRMQQTAQETQISVEGTEDASLEPSTAHGSEEQGTNVNEDQEEAVSSVVETQQETQISIDTEALTLETHQSPEQEIESPSSTNIDNTYLPNGEETEPIVSNIQGTVDAVAEDTAQDDIDRADNNTDNHSLPDTAVPQQDQAPTEDSSTSTVPQTPKVQKNRTRSPKSTDPLRKSKSAGIRKGRSPKRNVTRSIKRFTNKHCLTLTAVAVGLLAGCYAVSGGIPTAAPSSREWVVDSTALQHIAKDGNSFHNKAALYESCAWERWGQSLKCSGPVQLTFDNGKKLMLEDVLYKPRAPNNVVSLNKLGANGISGAWTGNEITVYNETSGEMVGKAIFGGSAYTLDGLVREKTTIPSTTPETAKTALTTAPGTTQTPYGPTPVNATRITSRAYDLFSWLPETPSIPKTSSIPKLPTVELTPSSTKKRSLKDATQSSSKKARTSLAVPSSKSQIAPTSAPRSIWWPMSGPRVSSKKRSLDDALQSSSKKARTSSASPSSTSQNAPTCAPRSIWWPMCVPQVSWPKDDVPSADVAIPTDQATVPSATAEPSTGDKSSSSGASWFGSFGKSKRVDPIQYTKEKLAEAKAETARKNGELKEYVNVEGKACPPCPPCPPCKEGWSVPRINPGRTGIYF